MSTVSYVFAQEALTTTDAATRNPLVLGRSAAESTPTVDSPSSGVLAPRAVGDTVTPTDSLATSVVRVRDVAEGSSPTDSVGAALRYARSAQEALSCVDGGARVQTLHRLVSEAPAAPTDAVARQMRNVRGVREYAPADGASSRAATFRRSGSETMTASDAATRGFVWQAPLAETVTPTDTAQAVLVDPVIPVVLDASVSPTQIGIDQQAVVTMSFSVPVVAWEVRTGSTCPHDGTRLAHYVGAAVFTASATVQGDALVYGAQDIQVYGMSRHGVWSLSLPR